MKISGIYEYSVRNFYMTFLKTKEQENQEFVEQIQKETYDHVKNTFKMSKYIPIIIIFVAILIFCFILSFTFLV